MSKEGPYDRRQSLLAVFSVRIQKSYVVIYEHLNRELLDVGPDVMGSNECILNTDLRHN